MEKKIHRKIIFKQKDYYSYVFLIIFLLIIFPFIIFEVISQTIGQIELSNLERIAKNPNQVESSTRQINSYYSNFSKNSKIFDIHLQIMNHINNPTFEQQIRKIHIIKMIINNTWFPEYTLYQQLAKIYFQMGYYEESLYYLKNHVVNNEDIIQSDIIDAYTLLFKINSHLNNHEQASRNAKNILQFLPNNIEWTFKLAQSYNRGNQLNLARQELEKIVYIDTSPSLRYDIIFNLIDILERAQLHEKINFYYRYMVASITNSTQKSDFFSKYAKFLIKTKDYDKALKTWQTPYLMTKSKKTKTKTKTIKNDFDKYLKT